jgi:hypothetical protein
MLFKKGSVLHDFYFKRGVNLGEKGVEYKVVGFLYPQKADKYEISGISIR